MEGRTMQKPFNCMNGDVGMHHVKNRSPHTNIIIYTIKQTRKIIRNPPYILYSGKGIWMHDCARILDSIAKGTLFLP